MLLLSIFVGLIILILLVVVHELGHGIVARRNDVVVEEFGIGFPPKAWGKKVKRSILGKNVKFTLNWLPLGGFVKLQGEYDDSNKKGDYGAASYWVKTKILLAGVLMNWVVAAVILTGIALAGMPKIIENQFSVATDTVTTSRPLQVALVAEGSAASEAGLEVGDELLRVNGQSVVTSEQLADATEANRGREVEIIYDCGDTEMSSRVKLADKTTEERGFLGVATREREEQRSTWSAPLVGVGTTIQFTWVTLSGVGQLATDAATGALQSLSPNESTRQAGGESLETVSQSVAGPVGILGVIFPEAQAAGLKQLAFLTAIISLSLAVMNILPIPALDGGRWYTMTAFRLFKKRLTREREEKIQTAGFLFLMALIVLITIADVGKF